MLIAFAAGGPSVPREMTVIPEMMHVGSDFDQLVNEGVWVVWVSWFSTQTVTGQRRRL